MKIGLALGSGAARGWAHIGVIQALEALNIKIDVVAGCSIGAYVGSAYASNKLPELSDWVQSLTEWQVFSLMGVGFQRGGLVSGQKVFTALEDTFAAKSFAELSKPFAAVATDLYSGKEVNFTTGSIVEAVKASCAIPGLFPPVLHQNRWLVDGAVVNPVPVNMCRLLGADIVIAVNLSADFRPQSLADNQIDHGLNQKKTSDFFKRSKGQIKQWFSKSGNQEVAEQILKENSQDNVLNDECLEVLDPVSIDNSGLQQANVNVPPAPSIINAMTGSLDILTARVTRSRLAGDPPDILIEPQLRDFGMMEFYRATELITEGKNSVDRIAKQIKYQLNLKDG
ncbi:patatin-like phospholipase family protein [Paraglaciecola aquimarina]|uniref:Patatin-like phospholipase family protein n=1 Tax=Paraglaciecola aquimarina TaxID=1235557 RepID=A0ABU3SYK0_9ALTE|nr:patatin-like phospholipase family protein [Paraglaciecola aquimarina]MDU0355087.1 patatin-like phospholipase family protein [Paraglaciecola aquimarina]